MGDAQSAPVKLCTVVRAPDGVSLNTVPLPPSRYATARQVTRLRDQNFLLRARLRRDETARQLRIYTDLIFWGAQAAGLLLSVARRKIGPVVSLQQTNRRWGQSTGQSPTTISGSNEDRGIFLCNGQQLSRRSRRLACPVFPSNDSGSAHSDVRGEYSLTRIESRANMRYLLRFQRGWRRDAMCPQSFLFLQRPQSFFCRGNQSRAVKRFKACESRANRGFPPR
jgi:hypothetical protein